MRWAVAAADVLLSAEWVVAGDVLRAMRGTESRTFRDKPPHEVSCLPTPPKPMAADDKVEVPCGTRASVAAASRHGTGAECGRRLRRGDVRVNILIVRLNGYVGENERTWFVGEPSAARAHAYAAASRATKAAAAAFATTTGWS